MSLSDILGVSVDECFSALTLHGDQADQAADYLIHRGLNNRTTSSDQLSPMKVSEGTGGTDGPEDAANSGNSSGSTGEGSLKNSNKSLRHSEYRDLSVPKRSTVGSMKTIVGGLRVGGATSVLEWSRLPERSAASGGGATQAESTKSFISATGVARIFEDSSKTDGEEVPTPMPHQPLRPRELLDQALENVTRGGPPRSLLEKALQAASAAGGSSAAQREWATEVSGGAGQAYADWRQVKESSADREGLSHHLLPCHLPIQRVSFKESLHVVVDLSLLPSTELKQNEKDERDVKARVDRARSTWLFQRIQMSWIASPQMLI